MTDQKGEDFPTSSSNDAKLLSKSENGVDKIESEDIMNHMGEPTDSSCPKGTVTIPSTNDETLPIVETDKASRCPIESIVNEESFTNPMEDIVIKKEEDTNLEVIPRANECSNENVSVESSIMNQSNVKVDNLIEINSTTIEGFSDKALPVPIIERIDSSKSVIISDKNSSSIIEKCSSDNFASIVKDESYMGTTNFASTAIEDVSEIENTSLEIDSTRNQSSPTESSNKISSTTKKDERNIENASTTVIEISNSIEDTTLSGLSADKTTTSTNNETSKNDLDGGSQLINEKNPNIDQTHTNISFQNENNVTSLNRLGEEKNIKICDKSNDRRSRNELIEAKNCEVPSDKDLDVKKSGEVFVMKDINETSMCDENKEVGEKRFKLSTDQVGTNELEMSNDELGKQLNNIDVVGKESESNDSKDKTESVIVKSENFDKDLNSAPSRKKVQNPSKNIKFNDEYCKSDEVSNKTGKDNLETDLKDGDAEKMDVDQDENQLDRCIKKEEEADEGSSSFSELMEVDNSDIPQTSTIDNEALRGNIIINEVGNADKEDVNVLNSNEGTDVKQSNIVADRIYVIKDHIDTNDVTNQEVPTDKLVNVNIVVNENNSNPESINENKINETVANANDTIIQKTHTDIRKKTDFVQPKTMENEIEKHSNKVTSENANFNTVTKQMENVQNGGDDKFSSKIIPKLTIVTRKRSSSQCNTVDKNVDKQKQVAEENVNGSSRKCSNNRREQHKKPKLEDKTKVGETETPSTSSLKNIEENSVTLTEKSSNLKEDEIVKVEVSVETTADDRKEVQIETISGSKNSLEDIIHSQKEREISNKTTDNNDNDKSNRDQSSDIETKRTRSHKRSRYDKDRSHLDSKNERTEDVVINEKTKTPSKSVDKGGEKAQETICSTLMNASIKNEEDTNVANEIKIEEDEIDRNEKDSDHQQENAVRDEINKDIFKIHESKEVEDDAFLKRKLRREREPCLKDLYLYQKPDQTPVVFNSQYNYESDFNGYTSEYYDSTIYMYQSYWSYVWEEYGIGDDKPLPEYKTGLYHSGDSPPQLSQSSATGTNHNVSSVHLNSTPLSSSRHARVPSSLTQGQSHSKPSQGQQTHTKSPLTQGQTNTRSSSGLGQTHSKSGSSSAQIVTHSKPSIQGQQIHTRSSASSQGQVYLKSPSIPGQQKLCSTQGQTAQKASSTPAQEHLKKSPSTLTPMSTPKENGLTDVRPPSQTPHPPSTPVTRSGRKFTTYHSKNDDYDFGDDLDDDENAGKPGLSDSATSNLKKDVVGNAHLTANSRKSTSDPSPKDVNGTKKLGSDVRKDSSSSSSKKSLDSKRSVVNNVNNKKSATAKKSIDFSNKKTPESAKKDVRRKSSSSEGPSKVGVSTRTAATTSDPSPSAAKPSKIVPTTKRELLQSKKAYFESRKHIDIPTRKECEDVYKFPLVKLGWRRELVCKNNKIDVYYYSPSGRKFHSFKEIHLYLPPDSELKPVHFDFRKEKLGLGPPLEVTKESVVRTLLCLDREQAPRRSFKSVTNSSRKSFFSKTNSALSARTKRRRLLKSKRAAEREQTDEDEDLNVAERGKEKPANERLNRSSKDNASTNEMEDAVRTLESPTVGNNSTTTNNDAGATDLDSRTEMGTALNEPSTPPNVAGKKRKIEESPKSNECTRHSSKKLKTNESNVVKAGKDVTLIESDGTKVSLNDTVVGIKDEIVETIANVSRSRIVLSTVRNTVNDLGNQFNAILHLCKYLRVEDLLRVARVNRLFNAAAHSHLLWQVVRLKNSKIYNWQEFAECLIRHNTHTLDMLKMITSTEPDENDAIWSQFYKVIGKIHSLQRLELGRVTGAEILNTASHCNKNLKEFSVIALKMATIDLKLFQGLTNLTSLQLRSFESKREHGLIMMNIPLLVNMTNLRHLSLTGVKNLKSYQTNMLKNFPPLESLELGDCVRLDDKFPENSLLDLKSLKRLRLENVLGSVANKFIQVISQLENLKTLELINIDTKKGFDELFSQLTQIENLLIFPTYITQSSTTNWLILNGLCDLKWNLKSLTWGVTQELLRVTNLFIHQWNSQKKLDQQFSKEQFLLKKNLNFLNCIPVMKPLPQIYQDSFLDESSKSSSICELDIICIDKLKQTLEQVLSTTQVKLLIIPVSSTTRVYLPN